MRVTFVRTATFDDIFADADFIALREKFDSEILVRRFVPAVIKQFWGGPVRPDSLTRYARYWASTHGTSDPDTPNVITEAANLLDSLYSTWSGHLGNLRGALVEGMVLARLEPRYRANQLEDNATVTVENGINYTTPTTIDVSGWDGNRGECHDCKVRTKNVDLDLVRSLEDNLPQPEFRVGVVTVDSGAWMAKTLLGRGYAPAPITTLIPLEELWELAPLQQPAR
jgi:hypothetical protein